MRKYIELSPQIMAHESWLTDSTEVNATLEWLDNNPEHVPGRTITPEALANAWENAEVVDEYQTGDVMIYMDESGDAASVFTADNARTAIDNQRRLSRAPEPTNAEKLETEIRELFQEPSQSFSIARDLAKKLDEAGVKAPGGGNE